MPKKDVIEVEGIIKESLPNAMFLVELVNGHTVLAHLGQDTAELHPHSAWRQGTVGAVALRFEAGRIVYRYK